MPPKPRDPPPNGMASIHAVPRHDRAPKHASLHDEQSAIVALVDELAILAADLWLAGKLDGFASHEEAGDDEDE